MMMFFLWISLKECLQNGTKFFSQYKKNKTNKKKPHKKTQSLLIKDLGWFY